MKWINYLIHWIINWLIYQLLSLNELWGMHFSEKRITNTHLTNDRKYPYQYWVYDRKFSNESFLNTHLPNWRKCIIGMWYALVFQGRLTVIFESIMERNHIMCELFSVKGGISKHIGIHSEVNHFNVMRYPHWWCKDSLPLPHWRWAISYVRHEAFFVVSSQHFY